MDIFYRPLYRIITLACLITALSTGLTRANLVISPIWDSSISNDLNASQITNTILQALANYQATFSNNITVTIQFQEMGGGLGESTTFFNIISYQLYRSHLASHQTTINDTNALSHLPNTTTNPVNNAIMTYVNLATGRAIGLNGITSDGFDGNNVGWNSPTNYDAQIALNTSQMNLSRAVTNAAKYDLLDVAEHEIDEVLGIGSALTEVNSGFPFPTDHADPEDFFRYDQNGIRSFTTNSTAQSYFSIDGKTLYARFNQTFGDDFNDWFGPGDGSPVRVQDAVGTPGKAVNLNVELIVLDTLGYNLLIPRMTVTRLNRTNSTIAWLPATPGYLLTESTNIASTNWLNSSSGTNNPVTITNVIPRVKFYRLDHE
jgi:hypothetical protein